VFKCLSRFIILLAAVQILGGHWMALQSVAWVGMLTDYARSSSLVAAIEKTLDGTHPCGLCEVVKTGREQEQKQQATKAIVKLEATLFPASLLPLPTFSDWKYPTHIPTLAARTSAPPVPPPLIA
jgi:hypothetical protein